MIILTLNWANTIVIIVFKITYIIDESEIIYVFCDAVNYTLYLERVKNSITPFAPSTNTNNPTSNVDNTPVFTNIG